MTHPIDDDQPVITDLMALMDASVRQGRAVERCDEYAAGFAYRDALVALGRLLARLDPDTAEAARAAIATRDAHQAAA